MNFESLKEGTDKANKIDYPISKVVVFLENLGAKIHLGYTSQRFYGETDYTKNLIKVGNLTKESDILFTLIHEGGHFLSNMRLQHYGLKGSSFEREFWAFTHGWIIIQRLNISIKKEDWIQFHKLELSAYEQFKKRKK